MNASRRRVGSLAALVTVASVGVAATLPAQAGVVLPSVPPAVTALTTGDLSAFQWALAATNTQAAWSASTGSGVTVAVVDTGVDASHPDLQGQVLDGARWVWDASVHKVVLQDSTVAQTSDDWYGHGSHVSGIIAADRDGNGISGVAPDAKILPIQLFSRSAFRHLDDVRFLRAVAESVRWANAHGAQVVNLSLGAQVSGIVDDPGTHPYLTAAHKVCQAVDDATAAGTLVVVSAGNSGDYGNPANVPATCTSALTVAATTPSLERTFWSSFDGNVRIAAPGESVLSDASTVAFGGNPLYVEESGTSMAAPMVAGAAALVFAEHPAWTPDQVANRLTATAQDWGPPGRDAQYGFGQLDSAAAVGVAAPPVAPVDYLTTSAEPFFGSVGPDYSQAMVSWNVPAADAVTSYTVRRYGADGSVTDTSVGGTAVRAALPAVHGDWIQVIAHTTAGDTASWPIWWLNPDQVAADSTPPPVRHPRASRGHDSILVSWQAPRHTRLIDQVYVGVDLNGPGVQRFIPVRSGKAFPTHVRIPLPRSARSADARVVVITINGNRGFGWDWFFGFAAVPHALPAVYGMHVTQLVGAGRSAAEVVGGVSRANAQQVCGRAACAGRRILVHVRRAAGVVQTVPGRLTSDGVFHVVVWLPKGDRGAVLRVTGPKGLDSGPYRRYSIGPRPRGK